MKSILYVGATLMIGASIYGFVDYKQTKGKKEFKEMYAEEKETAPVVAIADNKTIEPVVKKDASTNNRNVVTNRKVISKKQVVGKEEESITSIKPISDDEKIATTDTKEIGIATVDLKVSNDVAVEKKIKKKRKISTKLFSRGGMDDRYIEPKVKKEVLKDEGKKNEIKEQ